MSEDKKPVRKRRVGNPALTGDALNLEPGDNAKFISVALQINNLPDIDINDVEQVRQRINDYFALTAAADLKPAVSGLAMALGIDRRGLWGIVNDRAPGGKPGQKPRNICPACTNAIKKAYKNMEFLWENYMSAGKINPVSGIFLGKNNYGYVDKVDHVITPGVQSSDFAADDIASRYLTDSDPAPTLPEGSDSPTLTDSDT